MDHTRKIQTGGKEQKGYTMKKLKGNEILQIISKNQMLNLSPTVLML